MTLALLLTAVTGAWAQSSLNVVEFEVPAAWEGGESYVTAADLPGFKTSTLAEAQAWTGAPTDVGAMLIYAFDGENMYYVSFMGGKHNTDENATMSKNIAFDQKSYFKIYYTKDPNFIDVTPVTGKTNEWTFQMPAFDVEIAPIYAPVAQWAKVDNVDQLPTAIEGIYAGTEKAIVNAGTVAKIGETENVQGEVMYFATTDAEMTAEKAAKAEGWFATVPTAAGYDGAQTVYVWYYIKGANTPEGETASAENTFNDSEICKTPITVNVLSNKFDIEFKAANANTIEAGKATVKVGETDKTSDITDGKLQGVKMDSKVTVTAKDGYKFRSVEVEKTGAVSYTLISEATTSDYGKVVCAAGHLHDAKTAVPRRCTAVGILGKVTTTGHGLILALKDAPQQTWNTINGWTSVTTYASTTLKQLPDDTARGTNLTSYTTLGSTAVSNWCVAQKSDYEAIFTNLGSTTGDSDGMTYDGNVNAYITTRVGGTPMSNVYWSATYRQGNICWSFDYISWGNYNKTDSLRVWPVLAF